MKSLFPLLILALLVLSPVGVARADGIIIPQPPDCQDCPPPPCPPPFPCPIPSPMIQLAIRSHHVSVTIQDQLAVTRVDQVFYNPNSWEVDGLYIFPVPEQAAISSFSLWVDGERVAAQMLEADQARQQYWEIVNMLRDPALLEYLEQGAFQMHVYPIPPGGERRVELEYAETLMAENGLVRYLFPLSTEKYSLWPLEEVSLKVQIKSSQTLRAVYSPSHPVEVERQSSHQVNASYEASQVIPDKDFALYFSVGSEPGMHLLTYRDPSQPGDPDGYFLLLLAPDPETESAPVAKDVLMVLDRSGSMEGEKFSQAQQALLYILEKLNPQDRFNLVTFSTSVEVFSPGLQTIEAVSEAKRWVEGLSAQGSTDINRALLEAAALCTSERPTYMVFLTDGLPTEGVLESQQILDNLSSTAPRNLRLFSFGVGYDVDTFLLDSLAQAHHGSNHYMLPGEQIDEVLSSFYARINTPLLTDLEVDFGEVVVYDLFPGALPDLFKGSQIILVGRYRHGGRSDLRLVGNIEGNLQIFDYPDVFFTQESPDDPILEALPQIWATRKIGHQLNRIRLDGPSPEIVEQIIKLSIRYGVVTPYTSYLVGDQSALGEEAQARLAREEYEREYSAQGAPVFGQLAVEKSAYQAAMSASKTVLTTQLEHQQALRYSGTHCFVLQDGIWLDSTYDPQQMEIRQVEFLSEEYIRLAESSPKLAGAFSLGSAVIAVIDGEAVQVIPGEGGPAQTYTILPVKPGFAEIPFAGEEGKTSTPGAFETIEPSEPEENGKSTPASPGICLGVWLTLGTVSILMVLLRKKEY